MYRIVHDDDVDDTARAAGQCSGGGVRGACPMLAGGYASLPSLTVADVTAGGDVFRARLSSRVFNDRTARHRLCGLSSERP